jgi:hypothetical protein
MLLIAELPNSTPASFNREAEVAQAVRTVDYVGKEKRKQFSEFHAFEFEQTCFPLENGRMSLRLRKPLKLLIDLDSLQFEVEGWDVKMDCAQLPQLPREVARKFLQFLRGAEAETLSEQEQATWARMLDYADFKQFSIDRSPPRYMEGRLESNAQVTIVEWHDGNRETLDWKVARALSEVNIGERFSAFVKLGDGNKPIAMERISLLPAASEPAEDECQAIP